MERKSLDVGEKYMSVVISIGNAKINFAGFLNKTKTGNQPDFKGEGIAIWIKEKQPKTEEE